MLLTRLLSVPNAPLIARSAGAIVLVMALPMLLMAATIAPQSIPNCALRRLRRHQRHDEHQHQELRPVFPQHVQ